MNENSPPSDIEAELIELRAEVREWLCTSCNWVYPGPPQDGLKCVICPRCGGNTMSRTRAQILDLESRLEKATRKTDHQQTSTDEHVLDGPLGSIHEMAVALQMQGMSDAALRLANAHDAIQDWIIQHEGDAQRYRKLKAQLQISDAIPDLLDGDDFDASVDVLPSPALEQSLKSAL
jgi:predicted RNA-binding Zn-ribbon protein involved in translation (DUF1610 family)